MPKVNANQFRYFIYFLINSVIHSCYSFQKFKHTLLFLSVKFCQTYQTTIDYISKNCIYIIYYIYKYIILINIGLCILIYNLETHRRFRKVFLNNFSYKPYNTENRHQMAEQAKTVK